MAKEAQPSLVTKTSLMLGLGETDEEIMQTMKGAVRPEFVAGFPRRQSVTTAHCIHPLHAQSFGRLASTA